MEVPKSHKPQAPRTHLFRWLALTLCLAGGALVYYALAGLPVGAVIDPSEITPVTFDNGRTAFAASPALRIGQLRHDRIGAPEDSTLRLFEDGRPLGPPHTLHIDIGALGGGRYSHWNGTIYFSAADSSDPRANGRAYSYSDRAQLPYGLLVAGVLLLAGSLWFGRKDLATAALRVAQHPRLRLNVAPGPGAAILLVAIALSWLFQLIIAARQDVSHGDVGTLIGYCFLVIAAQGMVVWAARKRAALLFALFGVVNTYSLYFVFSGDLTQYPIYLQLPLLLSLGALYFVVFRFMEQSGAWRVWVLAGAVLFAAGVGVAAVKPFFPESGPAEQAKPEFRDMRVVKFDRRPNVYFLGFDAMVPGTLGEKLLRLPNLPYLDVIERHGGRLLRNMFADQVPTKMFWATLFSIIRGADPEGIVVGKKPSLLLATFQQNGYDTHFSYATSYMGPDRGPFLTTYAVEQPYTTCTFLDPLPRQFGLLGYCALMDAGWLFADSDGTSRDEFYMERLRSAIRSGKSKPQFFSTHVPFPGHTALAYRNTPAQLEEFSKRYLGYSGAAARLMDRMLSAIRASDPGGIVFVFGDHGGWISRGMDYSDNPDFVVKDRHGILGAVLGAEACLPFLREPDGKRYQTAARVAAGLLQCLAGGTSPMLVEHEFSRIYQSPINLRFEDFAYE